MTTAFIFPGQGSQFIGMGKNLRDNFLSAREVFECVDETLKQNLSGLMMEGEVSELQLTVNTQPALMAMSIAVIEVLKKEAGFTFESNVSYMAGHSLGEYSALCADQVVSLPETAKLLRIRGQAMQEAVPAGEGGMAAILGLDDSAVEAACTSAVQGDVVSAVNYNSPGQVVIAGSKAAVERAIAACQEAGAKRALALPVSVPSHCALMRPAAERLAEAMQAIELRAPRYTVIQNVDAQAHADVDTLRTRLIEQLYQPVRWSSCVEAMSEQGANVFIECGPGKVLTGLNKRIVRGAKGLAVNDPDSLDAALELARETLAGSA